jgi:hypothetical protein
MQRVIHAMLHARDVTGCVRDRQAGRACNGQAGLANQCRTLPVISLKRHDPVANDAESAAFVRTPIQSDCRAFFTLIAHS